MGTPPRSCCRRRKQRWRTSAVRRCGAPRWPGAAIQARKYEQHRVGERLWNGISTVRVNCGTAIVGTPDQAAEEFARYWDLGIDEFILSGYPHVEESRRVAREIVPRVRELVAARVGV